MTAKDFDRLVEIIQLIASDCKLQIQSFPDYVLVPDEIAQLLADSLLLIDSDKVLDKHKRDFLNRAKQLDSDFANFGKDQFRIDAFCTSKEWSQARELAQNMLKILGLERKTPDLGWVKFVKGQ